MKMMRVMIIASVVAVCGCATSDPDWEDALMGGAARSMVEAQKLNPGAAQDNAERIETGIDGQRAEKVMAVYRDSVVAKEETDGDIVINVGN